MQLKVIFYQTVFHINRFSQFNCYFYGCMQHNNPFPDFSFDDTAVAFSYKTSAQLKQAEWLFRLMNNNTLVKAGATFLPIMFSLRLPVKSLVKATIYKHFCGGETLEQCIPVVDRLASFKVGTILDYGVEAKESEKEFDRSTDAFIRSLRFAAGHNAVKFVSIKLTGLCSFYLLEKLQSGDALTEQDKKAWEKARERVHKICKTAFDENVSVMIDAEESWIQQPIDALAFEMMVEFNKSKPVVYNTVQLYRKDRYDFLAETYDSVRKHNVILAVKLVRGAYMEKERARAKKLGYDSPIQNDKNASDMDFNRAASFCLERIESISFCIASHNEFSNWKTATDALASHINPGHPHLHFSQLYGMSDNITFNLAREGFNVTKYLPYGPVRDVIPYLVRRAQENTSVAGQTNRELQLIEKELKRRTALKK